jgi:hypothetical protein
MEEQEMMKSETREIQLENLLRDAAGRRQKAQQLFQAAIRAGIELRRRPLTPGERKVRARLGIRSAFPEALPDVE